MTLVSWLYPHFQVSSVFSVTSVVNALLGSNGKRLQFPSNILDLLRALCVFHLPKATADRLCEAAFYRAESLGFPSIRCAATAAPYPLSMLTTVRPHAHDESMVNKGVMPDREAP